MKVSLIPIRTFWFIKIKKKRFVFKSRLSRFARIEYLIRRARSNIYSMVYKYFKTILRLLKVVTVYKNLKVKFILKTLQITRQHS